MSGEIEILPDERGLRFRVRAFEGFAPNSLNHLRACLMIVLETCDVRVDGRIEFISSPRSTWYDFLFIPRGSAPLDEIRYLPSNGVAQNIRKVFFISGKEKRTVTNEYFNAPTPAAATHD